MRKQGAQCLDCCQVLNSLYVVNGSVEIETIGLNGEQYMWANELALEADKDGWSWGHVEAQTIKKNVILKWTHILSRIFVERI